MPRVSATLVLACAAALAACHDAPAPAAEPTSPAEAHGSHPAAARGAPDAATSRMLADLRQATERFHSLPAAKAAGWKDSVTACMSSPAGAMGFHFADLSRFDATLDANAPEILVYAPQANGGMRLVAVEYAVPYAAWPRDAATAPTVLGQSLHHNDGFGLWVLHAWVWQGNARGVFEDWNPGVKC